MGDKFKAYRVSLVTADDVANGVAKGDLVYLHSAVPESEGMLFYFTSKPGGDEGVPLLMNQVERAPELDASGTETPEPGEGVLVPESTPVEVPPYNDSEPAAQNPRGAGLKFDTGKPQPRLLHEGVPLALAEVVETLTFGAQKYAAHSWQRVENAGDRYQDASYRHDMARCQGQTRDPETGISHRAHHIINELFLLELELRKEKAQA